MLNFIYNKIIPEKNLFAIVRPPIRSLFIVKMANHLGQIGFYKMLLEKVSDKVNWCPIELLHFYIQAIGNMHSIFFRDFALPFITSLKEYVFYNILKSPDSNVRNFTKEKIENVITGFNDLLKRIYSVDEKNEVFYF